MKMKNRLLKILRYLYLLCVIVFGLMAIVGCSGGGGGGGGGDDQTTTEETTTTTIPEDITAGKWDSGLWDQDVYAR